MRSYLCVFVSSTYVKKPYKTEDNFYMKVKNFKNLSWLGSKTIPYVSCVSICIQIHKMKKNDNNKP